MGSISSRSPHRSAWGSFDDLLTTLDTYVDDSGAIDDVGAGVLNGHLCGEGVGRRESNQNREGQR